MHHKRTTETPTQAHPATRGHTIRRWARFYDAVSWLMSRGKGPAIRKQAIALARVEAGQRVLDVGCGTGTLALALRAAVGADGEVSGVDA